MINTGGSDCRVEVSVGDTYDQRRVLWLPPHANQNFVLGEMFPGVGVTRVEYAADFPVHPRALIYEMTKVGRFPVDLVPFTAVDNRGNVPPSVDLSVIRDLEARGALRERTRPPH